MSETVIAAKYIVPADHVSIDPRVDIGHVHLKVSNLEKSIAFYVEVLGFDLVSRAGEKMAFVSAGGYHHHIGLNTWYSEGGFPPLPRSTGLFHYALRYPTRSALGKALRRIYEHGYQLHGASDHGVSEAIYLADPDYNGIELCWDRPQDQWPRDSKGELAMITEVLDLESLLAAADDE